MHVPVNRVFNNVSRNLGLDNYTQHIDTWAEWAFEAEQYIGSNNTFLKKEITYHKTKEAATAEIKFDNNNLNKSYIEIGGTRFYFRDATLSSYLQEKDTFIEIGADLNATMAETVDKISKSYYKNIKGITASWDSTTKILTLTYVRAGDEGNHVTLESDGHQRIMKSFSGGKEKLHNMQVRLPDNMVKLISVRHDDRIVYPTSSQFKSKVSTNANKYYIDGNRLNLSNDGYTGDLVVSYLAVPLSEEGYPMILQGHEEAVAFYIMWKYKSIGYYAGEVPQYIIKDLERRWYHLCAKVRGDDNMPNAGELLKIGKILNSKTRPRLYDGLNRY
jgi:hypothetical protein